MKKKILQDISLNSMQVVINQLSGITVFYILSNQLSKSNFGEINWSTALLATIFAILGAGIDQLTIKKIAAGENGKRMLEIYLSHVLITGITFYGIILIAHFLFPVFFTTHSLLLTLGISQLFVYFSAPFKQIATGREAFKTLFYLSVFSNIIRVTGLLALFAFDRITLPSVILLFIFSSLAELIICVALGSRLMNIPLSVKWHKVRYQLLLKESLPLLGSIIFNSGLARIDWILLGIFSTSVVLAEYSFAYKVFEVSTIPLIVIGPLLIPRFTRFFKDTSANSLLLTYKKLVFLAKFESMAAWALAMVLNIAWIPVIDAITGSRYGAVNTYTILVLSCTMPFIYINNLLWTVNLVQGRLKVIFYNVALTFTVNIVLNLTLIPILQGRGAAIAYFAAMVMQALHFSVKTPLSGVWIIWRQNVAYFIGALLCSVFSMYVFSNLIFQLLTAVSIYIALMVLCRQIKSADRSKFKEITGI